MILLNACASVLIFITCNLSFDNNGYYKIEPKPGSWLTIAETTCKNNRLRCRGNLGSLTHRHTEGEGFFRGQFQEVKDRQFLLHK